MSGQSVRETLNPHLGADEDVLELEIVEKPRHSLVFAVTNRRLIRMKRGSTSSGRDVEEVRAILLSGPSIRGTHVDKRTETKPDIVAILMGAGMGVVGLLLLMFGLLNSSGILMAGAVLIGFVLLLVGAIVTLRGMNTEPGHIEVDVLSTGRSETINLPTEADALAAKISEVVSNRSAA